MNKYVLYRALGTWYSTTRENYDARIRDERKVQRWDGYTSASEVLEFWKTWCDPNEVEVVE